MTEEQKKIHTGGTELVRWQGEEAICPQCKHHNAILFAKMIPCDCPKGFHHYYKCRDCGWVVMDPKYIEKVWPRDRE